MSIGIKVPTKIGVGDAVQFTSIPENYYRWKGEKVIDTDNHWVFDHNPFVERGIEVPKEKTFQLWSYNRQPPPPPRDSIFLSLAERHCNFVGIPSNKVVMKFPRLYRFEDFPFHQRESILLHVDGVSHGRMPDYIIEHVLKKYKGLPLFQVGKDSIDLGIPKVETSSLWDLALVISQARMFIGVDSGPSWIACCYPDVVVKKVRLKPSLEKLIDWVPQKVENHHSHWDDRTFQVYNVSENDVGFTASYRRL